MRTQKQSATVSSRLGNLRLFSGVTAAEAAEIISRVGGEVRRFGKGETIVHEGTRAKWLMPVLSGAVSVYEPGASGERHLVRSVEAGQLFGATLVTMRLEYYPGMAVAATDCEVVLLDMAKIRELWHDVRYRKFFENLYTAVSEYVLYCWRKMAIMSCAKTEDRLMLYLNWLVAEAGKREIAVPFTRVEDLARYLGVSRVSLSRAISSLVACGEIAHPGKGLFCIN